MHYNLNPLRESTTAPAKEGKELLLYHPGMKNEGKKFVKKKKFSDLGINSVADLRFCRR